MNVVRDKPFVALKKGHEKRKKYENTKIQEINSIEESNKQETFNDLIGSLNKENKSSNEIKIADFFKNLGHKNENISKNNLNDNFFSSFEQTKVNSNSALDIFPLNFQRNDSLHQDAKKFDTFTSNYPSTFSSLNNINFKITQNNQRNFFDASKPSRKDFQNFSSSINTSLINTSNTLGGFNMPKICIKSAQVFRSPQDDDNNNNNNNQNGLSSEGHSSSISSNSRNPHRTPLVNKNLANIISTTSSNSTSVQKNLNKTTSSSIRNIRKTANFNRTKSTSTWTPLKSPANEVNSCLVAVCEGRGQARGEVGIAALDVRRPHLILCQISDSPMYTNTLTKISLFNPYEVLVPNTFFENGQSKLTTLIRDMFSSTSVTLIKRRHFSDSLGLELIQKYCASEYSSVEIVLLHKFYALSAVNALLKYVEFTQNVVFMPKSLKIEYQASQDATLIDLNSATRLELTCGIKSRNRQQPSLLKVMDFCKTQAGQRLLRAAILQPPLSKKIIESRLDCVQELMDSPEIMNGLQGILPKFNEIDLMLTLSMETPKQDVKYYNIQIKKVLILKTCLELVPALVEIVHDGACEILTSVRETCIQPCHKLILERILKTIHSDVHLSKGYFQGTMHQGFSIKPDINGLLDVAKRVYCEIIDDMIELISTLSQKYNLPLSLGCTASRGFHIQMTLGSRKNSISEIHLPQEFLRIQKTRNTYTFTTEEVNFLDARAKQVYQEIQTLNNVVIYELLTDIREHVGILYKLIEVIAELDVATSLAQVSSSKNYVRPTFGPNLYIQEGRNPILESVSSSIPVPNDTYASKYFNLHIISGPNMSGKSVYIRQIALLQIMAQVGCYVPALQAQFRIADQVFARIGFEDSIECNASTFVLELREMMYIRQTLGKQALIIIDELCRGTASEEGSATSWALVEDLMRSKSFIFLATHYLILTRLAEMYMNVTNHQMEVVEMEGDEDQPRIHLSYTHRLLPGPSNVQRYGLRLAVMLALPNELLVRANHLYDQLQTQFQTRSIPFNEITEDLKFYQIFTEIISLKNENFNYEKLQNLQRKYLMILENEQENCNNSEEENSEKVEIEETTFPSPLDESSQNEIVTEEDIN